MKTIKAIHLALREGFGEGFKAAPLARARAENKHGPKPDNLEAVVQRLERAMGERSNAVFKPSYLAKLLRCPEPVAKGVCYWLVRDGLAVFDKPTWSYRLTRSLVR